MKRNKIPQEDVKFDFVLFIESFFNEPIICKSCMFNCSFLSLPLQTFTLKHFSWAFFSSLLIYTLYSFIFMDIISTCFLSFSSLSLHADFILAVYAYFHFFMTFASFIILYSVPFFVEQEIISIIQLRRVWCICKNFYTYHT